MLRGHQFFSTWSSGYHDHISGEYEEDYDINQLKIEKSKEESTQL